jgi:hypothetical protein
MDFHVPDNSKMKDEKDVAFSILYVFLSISEPIREFEREIFFKIGADEEGFNSTKWAIVGACEGELENQHRFKGRLKEEFVTPSTFSREHWISEHTVEDSGKKLALALMLQALILYGLVSDDRVETVKAWMENNLKEGLSLFLELKDIYETMRALNVQKSYLDSRSYYEDSIKERLEQNAANMGHVKRSVELLLKNT